MKELFAAGAHFGYSRARRHPSLKERIFGFKNNTAIIDLEQTALALEAAKEFLEGLAAEGKVVVWVGTKSEATPAVARAAAETGMPAVTERWIGGTFTNFTEIRRRIDRLEDLKQKREAGELSVYTKRERAGIDKEIANLERYFSSFVSLKKLPAAIIVVDSGHEHIAVREAAQHHIPVVALANSDCDISAVTYPIIGNDASRTAISYIVGELAAAFKKGQDRVAAPAETPAA